MTILLDPTSELSPIIRPRLPRPARASTRRIGLLDISKRRGDIFLDNIEKLLRNDGHKVKRYRKPTHTRPAPVELQQQIATEVDLVIEGLAD